MESWRSIAIGILIFLGVAALTGRLYLGVSFTIAKVPPPRNRRAIVSAGLVFLACLAAGFSWLIVEPRLTVLTTALVGSLIVASLDWATFGHERRRAERMAARVAKMREKEGKK
jgi:hypothetical protein